jgi:cyclic pyranopterin phosphate synthase
MTMGRANNSSDHADAVGMTDRRPANGSLVDRHGRTIRYLRISVTDRCDLRCRYCMAEQMTFLPRAKLLSLDEIAIIAERFIARGVTRIRLSGGEPLVRRDVVDLVKRLGGHVGQGLDELTMTTNGTRLADHAQGLVDAGVRRINVSLDSRDPERFRYITRHGDVGQVIHGILSARDAGLAIKINMVALKGMNEDEIASMLSWCVSERLDLSLIETMPLGAIDEDRVDRFLPLTAVFDRLAAEFPLVRAGHRTGGPARYWQVEGSQTRLGLISPLTANFCDGCNRVRLTTEGKLYMCLGHEDQVDLKAALRDGGIEALDMAIDAGLAAKPARHDFRIEAGSAPAVSRHMSVTGG